MEKNQLQELAQKRRFNPHSNACMREGPDHAPRCKASINFHGEIFEGPRQSTTPSQAEHASDEVALNNLSTGGTSRSLTARVLDETGLYKNLLQETAHRVGVKLPVYTTVRSGPGHQPVFTCSVELAGMSFNGEQAKTKKQAEKNAAMAAWSALKQMPNLDCLQLKQIESSKEEEQVAVASVLANFRPKEDNKPLSQRDQHLQQKRKMASFNSSLQYQGYWRNNDTSCDGSSIFSFQQRQKQRDFLALRPPSGPKILPPLPFLQHSSSTSLEPSTPTKENSQFPSSRLIQDKFRESPPSLKEHHENEEDWINEISDAKGKSIAKDPYTVKPAQAFEPIRTYPRSFPQPYQRSQQTHTSTRPFTRPPHLHPPIGALAPMKNSLAMQIPEIMGISRFHTSGIAPAVNIRSAIPVYAAPPMRPLPPPNTSVIHKKEQEGISKATSKFNKLQL